MKKLLLLLLMTVIMSGCSKREPLTYLETEDVILAFGDSLTFGYGAPIDQSYPSHLSRIINRKVINDGISGDTTAGGLKRIQDSLEKNQPKLVLLSLGGNDMLRKVPEETIKENLRAIINKIKDKNIEVILIAEPQPSILALSTGLFDAAFYKKLAKEENIIIIEDIFSNLLSEEKYRSDRIHLNAEGYKIVSLKIKETLIKYEAIY